MVWPLFRYILMAALRDRLILSLVALMLVVLSLSVFFGGTVVTEQDQFVRTFAAFGVRLFGVVALVMFVVTYIRRSFENREVEYLLSRPIGRIRFILTHAAGFTFLSLLAALVLGGAVVILQFFNIHAGAVMWWISLAVEFSIMANVAMFFAFVLTSQTICLIVVFAFYLLSRLMGEILGILQKGGQTGAMNILGKIMEMISVFIPRLDLMGQGKWLLYGAPEAISVPFLLAQGCVFLAMIVGASVLDMHRRQF
jgi:hypothetical protein